MDLDFTTALVLTALILGVGHLLAAAIWPYKACKSCSGGKKRSPSARYWRSCRVCGGSGKQLRFGRHVLDWMRAHRR
ncbi:hypothetical protein DFQ14_12216 [Halopolyspora algeriensis]|uniref:Uncharacterized protein n=1 Tax=Halopolyspora algeriensis TaxID=1500506 RepID=A0A368VCQ6_9ACTN|nr:hypothetical protein [Halopolyspora algeriensis]RCW38473.1 hypothetical protein DFQ14_12216 [Halopolyspora algeriensis]TQM42646.1 hypothetical protein FHU43_4285 [Halopolyspora algeriensis]